MRIVKEKISTSNGSCNFCDKGEINSSGFGLKYPYDEVLSFQRNGNGLSANICKECLRELNQTAEELNF